MTPAEFAARSRANQGLPERVEDPAALARIARLIAAGSRPDSDGRAAA